MTYLIFSGPDKVHRQVSYLQLSQEPNINRQVNIKFTDKISETSLELCN